MDIVFENSNYTVPQDIVLSMLNITPITLNDAKRMAEECFKNYSAAVKMFEMSRGIELARSKAVFRILCVMEDISAYNELLASMEDLPACTEECSRYIIEYLKTIKISQTEEEIYD